MSKKILIVSLIQSHSKEITFMSSSNHIKTLAEAIEKLEKAGSAKASDLKQNFEKDFQQKVIAKDLTKHYT